MALLQRSPVDMALRRAPDSSRPYRHPLRGSFRFLLDRNGRQHFNFAQCVWLNAAVPMAFTQVPSTALTTLALNILVLASDIELCRGKFEGPSAHRCNTLARRFAEECLLGAPPGGWLIPRDVVRTWAAAHRPPGRESR